MWATSLTSFFMDLSSEMITRLLPLFLSNVLGVKTNLIGLIEGMAEATATAIIADIVPETVRGTACGTYARAFFDLRIMEVLCKPGFCEESRQVAGLRIGRASASLARMLVAHDDIGSRNAMQSRVIMAGHDQDTEIPLGQCTQTHQTAPCHV